MTAVQSSARAVRMVDVDHLLQRLKALGQHQRNGGFVGRAADTHSAIELIRRDLACVARKGDPID